MWGVTRLQAVLLSTKMGGIRPLWGIISKDGRLQCECHLGASREKSGKHFRNSTFNLLYEVDAGIPSYDSTQIIIWERITRTGTFAFTRAKGQWQSMLNTDQTTRM
jgi:hypothetical protein